jgi:hypothetical protein
MTNNCPHVSGLHLCNERLAKENQDFTGTGGISKENQSLGFSPAFIDTETGKIYLSCHKDGTPAAIHMLDGLPEELIIARDLQNKIVAVKSSVIPGFVKDGEFYTREQAAELVRE